MSEQKTPMRRAVSPSVPFILDIEDANGDKFSESFQLCFDCNAFAAFEEATGLSMIDNLQQVWGKPSIRNVTAMFWAAAIENQPEYANIEGLKLIRHNMRLSVVGAAFKALKKAFALQLPKDKREALEAREAAIARGENPAPLASAEASTAASQ